MFSPISTGASELRNRARPRAPVFPDALDGALPFGKHEGEGVPDVDHVVPDFQLDVNARSAGAFSETRRVVE